MSKIKEIKEFFVMKNLSKTIRIFVFTMLIGFLFVACGEAGGGGTGSLPTSLGGGNNHIAITNVAIIVTAPVMGAVPNTTADGIGNFTVGAVSWIPSDNTFLGETVYTATVTLTANSGYTFTGLSSSTINGQNATRSNHTDTNVTLSYTFPETDTRTATSMTILTQPVKMTYTHGEQLSLSGLTIRINYSDATSEIIDASDFALRNITTSPLQGDSLAYVFHNGQPIIIQYGNLTQSTSTMTVNLAQLTIGTPSNIIYSNNHQINGVFRNALTPLRELPSGGDYTERTATFTVSVSGFINDSDARNVGLKIENENGLSFSGYDAIGNASGGMKTFNITIEYASGMFAAGSVNIIITGLFNINYSWPNALVSYNTHNSVTTTINIIDGRNTNRAIPVNQANIAAFSDTAILPTGGRELHYILTENIVLPTVGTGQSNWNTICNDYIGLYPFTGTFDGQGHTISNLTILRPSSDAPQGLFGRVEGVIKNLGLVNVLISGGSTVGGIAGNVGWLGRIINCFVTGNVKGVGGVGGVAGTVSSYGRIANSYSSAVISGDSYVGGVSGSLGGSFGGYIENCYSTGNVTGRNKIGGLTGEITNLGSDYSSSITNSFATGNVSGNDNVGGLVGEINGSYVINSVALNSTITKTGGTENNFGRIAGLTNRIYLDYLSNHANSDMNAVGGFVFPANEFNINGKNGADVNLSATQNQSWWENTAMFNFGNNDENPWKWDSNNQRPKLYWE
jgi:hypothetical protein